MKPIRILLADPDDAFRETLAAGLVRETDLAVVASTGMLRQAIHCLPIGVDVVVMDLTLQGGDALALLETATRLHRRPTVLILSAFLQTPLMTQAEELGADFFLRKPCRISSVIWHIRQLTGPEAAFGTSLEAQISTALDELGIPRHTKGYRHLQLAILMAAERIEVINGITKELYPALAKRSGSTPSSVERSIRHAIRQAWEQGSHEVHRKYFGHTVSATKGNPTNSEFIALLADRIRLQRGQMVR